MSKMSKDSKSPQKKDNENDEEYFLRLHKEDNDDGC